MGNYRFRLSDMIPNAWFYKLRDMGRSRKKQSSSSSHQKRRPPTSSPNSQKSTSRYSYYITNQPIQRDKFSSSKSMSTQFPDPPRKSSSKRRTKRKTIYKPSPKPGFGSNEKSSSIPTYSPDYSSSSPFESLSEPEEDHKSFDQHVSTRASSCKCRVSSSVEDIIIDMDEEERKPFARKLDEAKGFGSASELDLPTILTKPVKPEKERVMIHKDRSKTTSTSPVPARKSLSNSTGIRLRSNSPRIATTRKHHQPGARKSVSSLARNGPVSESFVVVKSSVDPKRDFRDSMIEMIVENNISASKDLEELLACYLSLNSNEYHDVIVKAFEEIWLDMTRLRP